MPASPLVRFAAAAAAALLATTAGADSVRCDGGLVATGDSKLDLLAKCGPPTLAEGAVAERSALEATGGQARRVVAPVEIWTYDLGKGRFTQLVRLVRGRVASIERGGYGYADAPPPPVRPKKADCDPASLSEGMLELDVLARCGEPTVADSWLEEVAVVVPSGEGDVAAVQSATVQLLTYDFGPAHFVRYVQVEDGKVTRVETGSYGYAR